MKLTGSSRAGWAHVVTLGVLALVSAAGATLTMQPGRAVCSAGSSACAHGGMDCGAGSVEPAVEDRRAAATVAEAAVFDGLLGRLDGAHREMVKNRIERATPEGARMSACFAPGTPSEVMEAFRAAEARLNHFDDRFQIAPRWTATAYTPGGSPLGKPVTVSYSIVPDGTPVDGFNGESANVSNLRAYLDGIYGSEATWLPILHSVFARWSQVSGINYIYEPNDDGQALSTFGGNSPFFGVPGVRGDVRISGHLIDGNSGVLAYNFYPDSGDALGGDMVVDTGDNFFGDTANGSVKLRNVLSHEHGHGMGQAHVCPIETTKLMEPFVTTVFDGPRQDDIRHAQYSYGDVNEPNDFAAEATDLGLLGCGTISIGDMPVPVGPVAGVITENPVASTVSLSDIADDDFYAVTVDRAAGISVLAVAVGSAYDDSAQACSGQSGSCCSGNPINSLTTIDLAVNVLDTDGTTLLATSTGASGQSQMVTDVLLPHAGTYYVQVKPSGATSISQFYMLSISTADRVLQAGLTGDSDTAVPAGELVPVGLKINDGTEAFDLGASHFYYSINGGATFVEAPLYDHGGGSYVAALADVPCGTTVPFYAELRSTSGSLVRLPCTGTYTPRSGDVFNIYSTEFATGTGWTVGPNTATAGIWELAAPIGTASAPGADHTGPGGTCFITGQGAVGGTLGAADVDNGSTLLTSPTMNAAGMQDAEISYWRWYATGAGGAPYADTFIVQASVNGGGNWFNAEVVGPGSRTDPNVNPGWRKASFMLSSIGLAPTASVRVRFNAQDTGTGSVVEAGVDDFSVRAFACAPVAWCEGDLNLDGLVEDIDFVIFAQAYGVLDCSEPLMAAGCPSDLNGDSVVDDADFVVFAAAYNALVCP